MYARVIVDAEVPGLDQPFTYRIPDELADAVDEGVCVAVPFAGRELVGYVLELTESAPDLSEVKNLLTAIPDACTLNSSLLKLAEWISGYYVAPLGHAVRAAVPEVMSATVNSTVRLVDGGKVSPASPGQRKLVEALAAMSGQADEDVLRAKAKLRNFSATLRQLRRRGAVEVVRTLELPKARPLVVRGLRAAEDASVPDAGALARRAPKQAAILKELAETGDAIRQAELLRRTDSSSSPARALVEKGLAERVDMRIRRDPFKFVPGPVERFSATPEQQDALAVIGDGLDSESGQTTLLYGVTGSGKTEVYLRGIASVLERGQSCIALVPEISLTVHLLARYKSRFGDQVAVLHSRLSVGERHDEWRRIESGEAKVVLGPRSAVFAPAEDLGLIVVDEEHEPSYKQEHSPRYNARAAAEERAREAGASVILGSATPSLETFYRASTGEIRLAVLGERIDGRPMPKATLVDLREEFEQGRRSIFSEVLKEAILDRLRRREQVILFVNRRGYASFILCRTCGYAPRCANCDVSLTYHTQPRMLRCHHCNASREAPSVCPECGGPHIRQFGIGTERVEEEARKTFPDASVIRMDSDTTARKNAHVQLLNMFRDGKADVLVGTQMVAKGLDFPNVSLVGVISADTILHLPDFRSAERTFQLLTQVSGRAGRGDVPGEVIIQSFSPEHYAVRAAARQDYLSFYGQEIAYRKELDYPPFTRLVSIVSTDPVAETAEDRLRNLAGELDRSVPRDSVGILGPAPAPLYKLKGLYRWHLVLRDRGTSGLQGIVRGALERSVGSRGLVVDVDPVAML